MAKSLNRVQLIGNLTRDPELRYTPSGAAVCSFGIATNRSWTTDTGEKRDEVDFHNIVAWRKLAEICSQYLKKGGKVYVEGRLTTRNWTGQDGQQKNRTEVVIEDMIMLDSKGAGGFAGHGGDADPGSSHEVKAQSQKPAARQNDKKGKRDGSEEGESQSSGEEEVSPDDIPF
jgi:single-strand DNA-binding protein